MVIFNELKKILEELFDLEGGEITQETLLIRDLGAESIDFLELAIAVKDHFNIPIIRFFDMHLKDNIPLKPMKVKDIVSYVESQLQKKDT